MGFSVKIAPGVRVRASSRGVRTSIGPRVARVHVGAGRTGLSTGAGPVGLYTAVGRTRRRPGSRGKSPSIASLQRQAAAARKAEAAAQKAEEAPPSCRPIVQSAHQVRRVWADCRTKAAARAIEMTKPNSPRKADHVRD